MDTVFTNVLIALVLLATNAFFVAAEFALVKARGFRIDSLAAQDRFAAKKTVEIQASLESYLAACQLGITMASLGLGWVGEPTAAVLLEPLFEPFGLSDKALHTTAFLVGFIVFSSLHIVVGEQVPKTLAIRKPEPISLLIAYPLHVFYVVCFPLTWLLNRTARGILNLLRIEEAPHNDILSNAEIRGLVDASALHGEMQEGQAEIINNIFRLDERAAERVMIPRVECHFLKIDTTPEENLRVIRETRHSRFPVIEEDAGNLVGMILIKDIVDALLSGESEPWRDLKKFCREPLVVPETLKISRLFETMRAEHAHLACVIDEYGSFVGLVTLEDLLEEIVGEIADEYDEEQSADEIREVSPHVVEVDARVRIDELNREFDYGLPHSDDFDTIGGFAFSHIGRIPSPGETPDWEKLGLTILDADTRRVLRVRIELLDGEPVADSVAAEQ